MKRLTSYIGALLAITLLQSCWEPEDCAAQFTDTLVVAFYGESEDPIAFDIDSIIISSTVEQKLEISAPTEQLRLPMDVAAEQIRFLIYKDADKWTLNLRYRRALSRNERCGTDLRIYLEEITQENFVAAKIVAPLISHENPIHVAVTL